MGSQRWMVRRENYTHPPVHLLKERERERERALLDPHATFYHCKKLLHFCCKMQMHSTFYTITQTVVYMYLPLSMVEVGKQDDTTEQLYKSDAELLGTALELEIATQPSSLLPSLLLSLSFSSESRYQQSPPTAPREARVWTRPLPPVEPYQPPDGPRPRTNYNQVRLNSSRLVHCRA